MLNEKLPVGYSIGYYRELRRSEDIGALFLPQKWFSLRNIKETSSSKEIIISSLSSSSSSHRPQPIISTIHIHNQTIKSFKMKFTSSQAIVVAMLALPSVLAAPATQDTSPALSPLEKRIQYFQPLGICKSGNDCKDPRWPYCVCAEIAIMPNFEVLITYNCAIKSGVGAC
jgi:hypothetical protein